MRKMRLSILFVLFFIVFPVPRETIAQNRIKTIIVFIPMNASMPSFQNLMEGFLNSLGEDHKLYNLQVEYLDIVRISSEDYIKTIVSQYNQKNKDIKIDLVITIGPFTYQVLKKHGLQVLETTPTIRIELDPQVEGMTDYPSNENTVDFKVKFRLDETLNHAFDMFPERKEVYIINGSSSTDKYFLNLMKQAAQRFQPFRHFFYITDITLDSTLKVARKIPENSIVFIPVYLSDKKNVPFSTPEAIELISENCKAPVFPIFDSFIKTKGGIGGFVFSYFNAGKETGRIAREILKGKKPTDVKVNTSSFYQHIYDWKQLERWHLLRSKTIPPDSTFFNREDDFLHLYRWQILVIFLILVTETILIGYLVKLYRRQKEIARQKTETETLYHEVIRQDRLSTMVELTASLSHELNQPLTAILYTAQAGKRFLSSGTLDTRQAEEIFDNIIEDDKRAAGLISSVKSMMKLEVREKEPVDLNAVIRETVNIFYAEAVRKNVHIRERLQNTTNLVSGDRVQLQQVLLNLMSNAAIAMEGIAPENKIIEISEVVKKGTVTVSVRDHGPGISDSIREKLFKPFSTTRESGFGIGLAVSRSIIEKHGGEIWAENIPGTGAEFSFKLQVIPNG